MSPARKRRRIDLARLPAATGEQLDVRFTGATPLRRLLNKVFPDHWSFMLGEIALYSFIMLLLTGTFLALFFDPSMTEVEYNGSYTPLRGVEMSRAYETSLNISFDVRGGLIMRQMHHWSALLFMAAIVVHMFRIFFTGAFRKPREANWIIGLLLFWVGLFTGFAGYGLPDDALSGTGLRIMSAITLSIPVIGSWVTTAVFGGEFPGNEILPRLYILHVFLLPGILLALIAVHMLLLVRQKHTQWPGPGRTNHNVVGVRMFPNFAMKAAGFSMVVFGLISLLGGLIQINPIWLFGPYKAAVVSSASQPDWYVMFLDGSTRLMPPWDIHIPLGDGYTIPALFWPTLVLPGLLTMVPMFYPFIEARLRKDRSALLPGARHLRRQRRGRREARHQPERDDLDRPDRPAGGPAGGLLRRLPRLPGSAAARPRGAGPRRRDGNHPAPARRPVHRGAPAAGRRRPARPRRAGLRRRRHPEEDEPPRRGRTGRPWLLLPGGEAGRAGPAARRRSGVTGRRADRHAGRRERPGHPGRGRGDGAGRARQPLTHTTALTTYAKGPASAPGRVLSLSPPIALPASVRRSTSWPKILASVEHLTVSFAKTGTTVEHLR
jgi:quinol-cytochrome oxidoreductase complex cytochrome b subunit